MSIINVALIVRHMNNQTRFFFSISSLHLDVKRRWHVKYTIVSIKHQIYIYSNCNNNNNDDVYYIDYSAG